jgi:hypothetical protein
VFADGVEDLFIIIQLLLEGEKTVTEALRQAVALQAVLLVASRPKKNMHQDILGVASCLEPDKETKDDQHAGALGSQATLG